ncbi:MAG: hypothetical protein WC389_21000 [Lutibacter sp.]|jgi:hypothetical protein
MEKIIDKIITVPKSGYKITKSEIIDGQVHTTIEKIEEKKDFDWYWNQYFEENLNGVPKINFNKCGWATLIDFYRWFAKELNGDWEPDWEYAHQYKFYIEFIHGKKKYASGNFSALDSSFGIVFSEEAVHKAFKILPKEFLDKLFQIQ